MVPLYRNHIQAPLLHRPQQLLQIRFWHCIPHFFRPSSKHLVYWLFDQSIVIFYIVFHPIPNTLDRVEIWRERRPINDLNATLQKVLNGTCCFVCWGVILHITHFFRGTSQKQLNSAINQRYCALAICFLRDIPPFLFLVESRVFHRILVLRARKAAPEYPTILSLVFFHYVR